MKTPDPNPSPVAIARRAKREWEALVDRTWLPPWPYGYTAGLADHLVGMVGSFLEERRGGETGDAEGPRLVVLCIHDDSRHEDGVVFAACDLLGGSYAGGWEPWTPVAVAALLGADGFALAFVRKERAGQLVPTEEERKLMKETYEPASVCGLEPVETIITTTCRYGEPGSWIVLGDDA